MFKHYLFISIRNLWKHKAQNLIGIIGLAIGFSCFALCSYISQMYFTRDTEYPGAGRMYKVNTEYNSVYNGDIYAALKAFPEVEKITIAENSSGKVIFFDDKGINTSPIISLMPVDTCFIDFFSLKILAGSTQSINRSTNGIVLFESKAKELSENFNELIGKTAKFLNDETEYQITGVVRNPKNSIIIDSHGLLLNCNSYLQREVYEKWDQNKARNTFLLLSSNSSFDSFQKSLQATDFGFKIDPQRLGYTIQENGDLVRREAKDEDEKFILKSVKKINSLESEIRIHIGIFAVGLLVFLMALFNYMSFQTALFYNRLKECAIRKTNGSGKAQIFLLFFSEILIAFLFAFVIAFLLIQQLLPLLTSVPFFYRIKPELLNIYLFLYLFFVVLLSAAFCLIPTYTINKLSIRTVFLGLSVKGKKSIGRDILLFVQMIILLIFISASSIVSFQTYNLKSGLLKNIPKEEHNRTFSAIVSKSMLDENNRAVMGQLSSSPLFEDIFLGYDEKITDISSVSQFNLSSNEEAQKQWVGKRTVPVNFFDFFHCKLLAGQLFSEDADPNDVVIDKTLADLLDTEEILGTTLGKYRIIGVINALEIDTKKERLSNTKMPVLYLNQEASTEYFRAVLYVKSVKGKEVEARKFMEDVLKKTVPEYVTIVTESLKEEIAGKLKYENMLFILLVLVFVTSLVIGLLSIYSAVAMNTEKRRKEVAIRKINGALLYDVILLFFRKYLIMWTAIFLIAVPFVYHFATSWLNNYLDRISLNVFFFTGIYLMILSLIMLTIITQILKVARENPAEVIKLE